MDWEMHVQKVFQVSLAGCRGWSQRVPDGLLLGATALAILHGHRCGSIPARGCPQDPAHGWAIVGVTAPRECLLLAQGRLAGKAEMVSQLPPPSWTLDPADGGAGKPSSGMKAAHRSISRFQGS